MALVLRKIKKAAPKTRSNANEDVTKAVIGSVVMLAYCGICADGEVSEAEIDSLRGIISSGFEALLDQQISDADVNEVILRADAAFEELGYDGMMRSAVEVVSQREELKHIALRFVATVIMSDGEYDAEGAESTFYDDLAQMLEVDEETSVALWNAASEQFE